MSPEEEQQLDHDLSLTSQPWEDIQRDSGTFQVQTFRPHKSSGNPGCCSTLLFPAEVQVPHPGSVGPSLTTEA